MALKGFISTSEKHLRYRSLELVANKHKWKTLALWWSRVSCPWMLQVPKWCKSFWLLPWTCSALEWRKSFRLVPHHMPHYYRCFLPCASKNAIIYWHS